MKRKKWPIRILIGGLLGAVLAPAAVYCLGSLLVPAAGHQAAQALGSLWAAGLPQVVTPAMVQTFGSAGLAALVQSLLGGVFGAVVAGATLPFADGGRELVLRSLLHFGATAASFSALLWVCRWVDRPRFILLWTALLALLYLLIWLGRWIGWYLEVVQLRTLLGLAPGPSPLKWRETLPYLPFALLVCDLLPLALGWIDRNVVVDVPVFSGLILPFLLLPAAGFFSGLSLGKRQGVCILYPVLCFLCYLPMVWLPFNGSALFHCFLIAVPALAGNVLGWLVPPRHPEGGEQAMKRELRLCHAVLPVWLLLLQLAGELTGLVVLFLTFDPFGGNAEMCAYGLLMLPLWMLWGYLTPRACRLKWPWTAGLLILWTGLVGGLDALLPDYRMLFALPQYSAGYALAQYLPIHYGSARYWRALPVMRAAAHVILPVLFALGLFLRQRRQKRTGGGTSGENGNAAL